MSKKDNENSLSRLFSAVTNLTVELTSLTAKGVIEISDLIVTEGKAALEKLDENQDEIKKQGIKTLDTGTAFLTSSIASAKDSVSGLYDDIRYSSEDIKELQNKIEDQGKEYRLICSKYTGLDTLILGGETLISMLVVDNVPQEILNAYSAAYPNLAEKISFEDKVFELGPGEIQGFISGVKGKLFEMQYVDYLNDGQLPEGYSAILAESATQPGWDIAIAGPSGETVDVLQAKATDSVAYVKEAIEKNPNIDVVTTDEVYSHLVLSGVSENVVESGIANVDLEQSLEDAISSTDISMDFTPPIFSLALIAFTSYSEDNLSLYEKSQIAGERSGKSYLSYLIGGGVAVLTNTWWLGLFGAVTSRYLSDSGIKKAVIIKEMEAVYAKNTEIIKKIKLRI